VHVNADWQRTTDWRNQLIRGIGGEGALNDTVALIAEAFGQNQGRPFQQFGMRLSILPNRPQLDATVGNRMGSSQDHWLTVGLRLVSPPFLP
jgi:hypothetical protein